MSQKIYSNLDIKGNATIGDIANATSDTDKFLVSDAGVVKYRTGSEMLSDLGVAPGVASNIQHQVKAGVAISKGQAVYVTGADGTNMIVGLASNSAESTSSKTMGLMASTVATNGFGNVIAEGLLAGLDTSTANAGDPVWLGTNGNLIYGLANKPSAPNHLVFIGIVTRANANNGEIFVKVQNGFELNEIHDVDTKTAAPVGNDILAFEGAPVNLWKNKTIASVLGYTPVSQSRTLTINGTTFDLSADRSWTIASGVTSFNTRTGAITLTSGDVTGALGYTPYNATNPNGYISSYTETDPTVPSHVKSITTTEKSNWNTAYGWGNHALAGYATSGHTHDLGRYSLRAPALIDSVTASNFRTQLFGSSTSGYNISTARFNTTPGLLSGLNNYGTMMAWSGSDTHGFLAIDYAGAGAIVGGGNADNINWTKRLAFLDDTVPNNRTITINGTSYDLSANRSWTVTASETDTLATVVARGNTANSSIAVRNSISINKSDGSSGGQLSYDSSINQLYLWNSLSSGYFSVYTNNAERLNISSGGAVTANVDMRSPIFYDSNNTGYYLDPASGSNVNNLTVAGTFSGGNNVVYGDGANGRSKNNTNANTSDSSNSSGFYFGSGVTGMPSADWWNWLTVAGNSWAGGDGYRWQMAYSFWGDDVRIRRQQSGSWYGWQSLLHSGNYSGYSYFSGAVYGTIFYDANNTGYYIDPTSNSQVSAIYANNWFRAQGNTGLYGQDYGVHFYPQTGSAWSITGSGGNIELQFRSNHNSTIRGYVYADTSNNIGFLTSGGGWRLRCDDSGNAIATGDVTAYSDRRVKENIHTIDNALDKVNNLRGVYYTRIDSEDKQRKVGVIAQETLEILPEVVGQDTDGMYNVAYGNITAVLIEAIKEQQKQIDELKELVNQLIKK